MARKSLPVTPAISPIVVTFGSDAEYTAGTASVRDGGGVIRSRSLKVDGKPVTKVIKGSPLPALALSGEQDKALQASMAQAVRTGRVILPGTRGRGRPPKVGTLLSSMVPARKPQATPATPTQTGTASDA